MVTVDVVGIFSSFHTPVVTQVWTSQVPSVNLDRSNIGGLLPMLDKMTLKFEFLSDKHYVKHWWITANVGLRYHIYNTYSFQR